MQILVNEADFLTLLQNIVDVHYWCDVHQMIRLEKVPVSSAFV